MTIHPLRDQRLGLTCVIAAVLGLANTGCSPPNRTASEKTGLQPDASNSPDDGKQKSPAPPANVISPAGDAATAAQMAEAMKRDDRTTWAKEVLAQKYEARFVRLWDELRGAKDPREVLKSFSFQQMIVGRKGKTQRHDWDVLVTPFLPPDATAKAWTPKQWQQFVDGFTRHFNFQVTQSEWHHSTFTPPADGQPAKSVVSMEIHLTNPKTNHRLAVVGELHVEWSSETDKDGGPVAATIDASRIKLVEREASAVFEKLLGIAPQPANDRGGVSIHPLIVHDLNGDGLPEIILGGADAIMWNEGDFKFRRTAICDKPLALRNSGCVADFNGDGADDLLAVNMKGRAVLCLGGPNGQFSSPQSPCWKPTAAFPSAITVGDVDGDGDLDVWFTQYKPPYRSGQMPTPFYDANDGHPSYLMLNDGNGRFTDATEESGLARRRNRRTYSASFVDLDDDGDLDLLTVNDFSGMDVYINDGQGHFTDATEQLLDHRHAFGMSHTFGDFDGDGRTDFYMVGMSSTTARRLDRLGLKRDDFTKYADMRAPMTYGNRMYLARDGRFEKPAMNARVARAGWSWGCSAFDFDNDGDDDLYVANGHMSGQSARDYCTRYWCHDVYAGTSKPDPEMARLLSDMFRPREYRGLNEGKISWNGFEHNKLYMNLAGKDFIEVGFPMDVAFEIDSRCVVTPDIDADGRPDLLVVGNRWIQKENRVVAKQELYVLRNRLETGHHWIGVRLRSRTNGVSPIGAKVVIHTTQGARERRIVTGDSFYSQRPAVAHFGLGSASEVREIVVHWPGGKVQRIANPAVDRYHEAVLNAGE
jgi:hypothetical protein